MPAEQGTEDAALVATTRLNANGRDAQATQALDQFGPAYRVVARPRNTGHGATASHPNGHYATSIPP